MRLFLALELSDSVRSHLCGFAQRWFAERTLAGAPVRAENLHVTVKFLGDVPDGHIPALCDALKSVSKTGVAQLFPDRLEFLPERGPIRIISAGLGGELDKVHLLYKSIEAACETIGFPREKRAYRPHVTLVRLRTFLEPHYRASVVSHGAGHFPGPLFSVGEFVLMQSQLHPKGARYIPLARFPLVEKN